MSENASAVRALKIEHSAARAALRQEIIRLWSAIDCRDEKIKQLESALKQVANTVIADHAGRH